MTQTWFQVVKNVGSMVLFLRKIGKLRFDAIVNVGGRVVGSGCFLPSPPTNRLNFLYGQLADDV